jgi:beta-glucosidase
VQTGRIKQSRIQESLARIWQAKQQVFADSTTITELSSDRARSTVNSILKNSLQQSKTSIITDPHALGRNLIVVDDLLNANYLDINSPAITIPQEYNYQRQLVDGNTLDCILLDSRPTLLQVFIRGNPFRGNAGLTNKTKAIYQQLITNQQVTGIAIYGSPYVLEWFKRIMGSDFPWVFTYGQMPQAQAIALKTLFTDNSQPLKFKSHNFGF